MVVLLVDDSVTVWKESSLQTEDEVSAVLL